MSSRASFHPMLPCRLPGLVGTAEHLLAMLHLLDARHLSRREPAVAHIWHAVEGCGQGLAHCEQADEAERIDFDLDEYRNGIPLSRERSASSTRRSTAFADDDVRRLRIQIRPLDGDKC